MDITEDVRNPGLVKHDIASGPSLIKAKIKALALEK
jgi:hypothetical protein